MLGFKHQNPERPLSAEEIHQIVSLELKNFDADFIKNFDNLQNQAYFFTFIDEKDLVNSSDWHTFARNLEATVSFWHNNFTSLKNQYGYRYAIRLRDEVPRLEMYIKVLAAFLDAHPWTPRKLMGVFDNNEGFFQNSGSH